MTDPIAISETAQDYEGERFYRHDGPKRYFRRPQRSGETYLHRVVWSRHNGAIPTGGHVHHKDGDRGNNGIGNLELLTPRQHVQHHRDQDPERWKADRARGLEAARERAKEWHASPEGRAWHRAHRATHASAVEARTIACTCEACGTAFMATRKAQFCCRACKAEGRRRSGVDDETRTCAHCAEPFKVNRYVAKRFCSRSCSSRSRSVTA